VTDIAELGFKVDSSPLAKAREEMGRFSKAADGVETAAGKATAAVNKTASASQKMAAEIQRSAVAWGTAIGQYITRVIDGLARMIKSVFTSAGNLADMSQKVGVSVEALSTLGFVADQSGVQIDALQVSLVKLARNAADVANGTGEAKDAFAELGVSVLGLDGKLKGSDTLLRELAGKFASLPDGVKKTALATEIFGRSGQQLIPMLNLGAQGIADLEQKARDLGIELDTNTAQQAEAFGDQMAQLQALLMGVGITVLREVLPMLQALAKLLIDTGVDARKAGEDSSFLRDAFEFLVVAAINTVEVFRNVGATIAFVVDLIGKLDEAVRASAKPLLTYLDAVTDALSGDLQGAVGKYTLALEQAKAAGTGIGESFRTAGAALKDSFADNAAAADASISSLAESMATTTTAARETDGALTTVGESAEEAAKRQDQLAKAQKQMTDLLGGLKGQLGPVAKAWEAYEKTIRDAVNIGKQLVKHGAAEAVVLAQVNEARERADDILQRTLATLAQEADIKGQVIAAMEEEVRLSAMTTEQRKVEEIVLRAIADAQKLANERLDDSLALDAEEQRALRKRVAGMLDVIAANEEMTHAAEEFERMLDTYRDSPFERMISEVQRLKEALDAAGDAAGDMGDPERLEALQAALNDAKATTVAFATDAIGQGISSLQSMATEGSKAYKALAVAQAANNVAAAIGAILEQGKGDPYTAFARMAAMAAAVAGLVGSIGNFSAGGGGGANSAASRQASQGTGTVLGDADAKSESMLNALEITADATQELVGINRGMLNALQDMQQGIGNAAGGLARTGFSDVNLSDAFGLGLGFSPADLMLGAIFGGDQDLIDQGLMVGGGTFGNVSRNPNASTYQTIETDGGWFSSDDIDDELEALGEQARTQIMLILTSIGDAVREGARALGMDMEEINAAIEAFRIEEIRISTMDLTGEEAQAELEAAFSAIFDNLAGAVVPFIDQFQQVGEGLGETLVRVATSVQVAQEAFYQLGLSVGELDPEQMAQVSVGLVEAAGGIDQFISGLQSFVNNFATEEHRFAVAQDELNRAFAQVGLTVPGTRDGMWELMQSLDATTAEGQEQIATLLRLSGVANSYYDLLDQRAEDALDLAERLAAEQAEIEAQWRAIGEMRERAAGIFGSARDTYGAPMSQRDRQQRDINRGIDEYIAQLREMHDPLNQIIELEALRADALARSAAAIDAEINELLDGLAFDLNLEGLTETEQALARVNQQYDGYLQQLLDLGATTEQLTRLELLRTAALAQVTAELEEVTEVATITFTEMREQLALFVTDLRDAFEHLLDPGYKNWIQEMTGFNDAAEQAIVSRADALEQIGQSYAAAIADVSTQLAMAQQEMADSGGLVGGPAGSVLRNKIAQLSALLAELTGAMGDAVDYANDLFAQQIDAMLGGLADEFGASDPLSDINERFDTLIEQATAWGATQEQLMQIEMYRQQAIADLRDEQFQAEWDWIRSLTGLLDSLLLDEALTTLTPAEQLAEAQRQYDEGLQALAAASLTVDTEDDALAREAFEGLARGLLAEGRDFFGSSPAYNALFNSVTADIQSLLDAASPVADANAVATAAIATAAAQTNVELATLRQESKDQTDATMARLEAIETESAETNELLGTVVLELRRLGDGNNQRTY
jgi:hypothetical protein